MPEVSDAEMRDEDIVVSKQYATVSYETPDYDWEEIPNEWCHNLREPKGISNRKIIDDIWTFKKSVPTSAFGIESLERKRWLRACAAWNNVDSDIRREYEERDRAERTARAKEQGKSVEAGERATRREFRKKHSNLVERAKALTSVTDLINFIDYRRDPNISPAQGTAMKAMGQIIPMLPSPTPINLQRFFDALFVGGVIEEVHYDTARRMLVDEDGVVVDAEWAARDLMEAARAVKLQGLSAEVLIKALKVWALTYKFNDISERVKTHLKSIELDDQGSLEEPLESFLIDTFKCANTDDNRLFSKYWCLSLYNRIMTPGCLAPITMALFGPMDAGKSYFSTLLCREIMFDAKADAVTFDPAGERKEFLRNIYGLSIVANMSEMTGFGKIDLRKWKSFSTNTTDTFDQKFGFSGQWPRQWIFISDANRYEGLWRDNDDTDTNDESQGERRLFPIFVGEIPGATGSVRWASDARANIEPNSFGERLWQMMKTCEAWMECHEERGYKKLVAATTSMVKRFSKAEKDADQGTVHDKTFDEQFPRVLRRCIEQRGIIGYVRVGADKVLGLRLLSGEIQTAYEYVTKRPTTPQQISKKMKAAGALKGRAGSGALNVTAFVFGDEDFSKLGDGYEDREQIAKDFERLYLHDAPASENEGKSEDELEGEEF